MATDGNSRSLTAVLEIFSIIVTAAGVARVAFSSKDIVERLDSTTLLYFVVAAALLLLPNVKKFKFGDLELELRDLREQVQEAKTAAENAQAAAMSPTAPPPGGMVFEEAGTIDPAMVNSDPWKGRFGGQSFTADRRLSATVVPLEGIADFYRVHLVVESTNPRRPLAGAVQFFLHPTFRNSTPIVAVAPNGRAELALNGWGAFTVGVVCDDGLTKLELDLAELESAPAAFRAR